jgi:hypothetical protein
MSDTHGTPEPHHIIEVATGEEPERPVDRSERIFEVAALIVLAAATLLAAWSGYQAVRWDGIEASQYAMAAALDVDAVTEEARANQAELEDGTLFIEWLNAHAAGDQQLQAMYEARFRPEYKPAFDAWLATDPFTNPSAPAGPAEMPQYQSADTTAAEQHAHDADVALEEGHHAKDTGDQFVLNTVFLASALFLAGISSRFDWRPIRILILILAFGTLAIAAIDVVRLPVA